jgi:HD-GYP domain-containing protein (c-di-GMP phosphodiesterase class II)
MRQHPVVGEGILAPTERMRGVAKIVRHHQEQWDGSGYPDGLRREEIPLGARILAVVDAYSAITDERPYKKAQSHEEAVAELRRGAGTRYDPRVVEVFCRIFSQVMRWTRVGTGDISSRTDP